MADQLYKGPFNEDMRLIDMGDGTFAERVDAYPPKKLMTDDDGDYARLRVDVEQTGFLAGREFRVNHEFSIASGATQVIKVVAGVDTILYDFMVELTLAELAVRLKSGGTEGGTFGNSISVMKTNQMSTASSYTSQVTMAYGGTHTGGTTIDTNYLISGANANKSTAEAAGQDNPLGFAAGTYYIILENTDGNTATGVFKARWEERP
jgi:hypothetical protein